MAWNVDAKECVTTTLFNVKQINVRTWVKKKFKIPIFLTPIHTKLR